MISIQLHREHRGPQRSRRSRRLACSLAGSTRKRASRFENKIVRSPENTQSLAGLPNLRGPLCPLCSFLPQLTTMKSTIEVTALFPIREKGIIMATLASFDWSFDEYSLVVLHLGDEKIEAQYIGSGNIKESAIVELAPTHPSTDLMDKIANLAGGLPHDIYIERKNTQAEGQKMGSALQKIDKILE